MPHSAATVLGHCGEDRSCPAPQDLPDCPLPPMLPPADVWDIWALAAPALVTNACLSRVYYCKSLEVALANFPPGAKPAAAGHPSAQPPWGRAVPTLGTLCVPRGWGLMLTGIGQHPVAAVGGHQEPRASPQSEAGDEAGRSHPSASSTGRGDGEVEFVECPPNPPCFFPAPLPAWAVVGWSAAGSVIDGRGTGLPSPACLEGAVFVLAGAGMSSPLPCTVTSWESQRGVVPERVPEWVPWQQQQRGLPQMGRVRSRRGKRTSRGTQWVWRG